MPLLVSTPLQIGAVFGLIILILVPLVLFVLLWDISGHMEQIADDMSQIRVNIEKISDELEHRETMDDEEQ